MPKNWKVKQYHVLGKLLIPFGLLILVAGIVFPTVFGVQLPAPMDEWPTGPPQLVFSIGYSYTNPGIYPGQSINLQCSAYVTNDSYGRAVAGYTIPAIGTVVFYVDGQYLTTVQTVAFGITGDAWDIPMTIGSVGDHVVSGTYTGPEGNATSEITLTVDPLPAAIPTPTESPSLTPSQSSNPIPFNPNAGQTMVSSLPQPRYSAVNWVSIVGFLMAVAGLLLLKKWF
jgi:hypothetical protein